MKALLLKLWRSSTQRVMSLTLVGKLVSLLADVLIAARLGTGQAADALFVALGFPLFVDTVTRQSAKYSLVPIFVEYRTEQRAQYHRFVSGLLNVALVFGAVLLAIAAVGAPWIVQFLGPGLPSEGKAQATQMLWTCAPLLLMAPVITVQGVVLNSEKRFSRVALRNAVTPGVVALTLLATWNVDSGIATWVAAAYSVGFGGYLVILAAGIWRRAAFRYRWWAWPTVKDVKEVREALSWPSVGFGVRQLTRLLERAIASLVAVGGVSAYYFAYRIFSGIQTVIGSSIATTGLPDLSKKNAKGKRKEANQLIRKQVVRTVLLVLPAVVVALLFSETVIDLVYGRGKFGPEAIRRTERLLFWFGPGILFACLIPIFMTVLYSMKKYRYVFANIVLIGALNICLAWLLARGVEFGLSGIAIAGSISAFCSVVSLIYLIRRTGMSLFEISATEIYQ